METESVFTVNSELHLDQPGLKLFNENEGHKSLIEKLCNLVMPIFEKINKHPENSTHYRLKKRQFYGAHPISLEKKYIKELADQQSDFLVCEKTDGTRYLLYISNLGEVYLSGRGDDFYLFNLPIPPSMIAKRSLEMSIMYIFDGELVIDECEGTKRLVYLLFDCIMFYNKLIFDQAYTDRLEYCLQFVTLRTNLMRLAHDSKISPITVSVDQEEITKQSSVQIYVKDFYPIGASGFLFNQLVPKLPHGNDGLIFTRNSKPYPLGATSNIIKWKPPEYNTIDFLVVNNVAWEEKYGKTILELYVTRYNKQTEETEYVLFDVMVTNEDKWNEIAEALEIRGVGDDMLYKNSGMEKKIIAECKFDSFQSNEELTKLLVNYQDNSEDSVTQLLVNSVLSSNMYNQEDLRRNIHYCFEKKIKSMKGGWVISKMRRDKNTLNAFMTAKNVFNCIFENIRIGDIEKAFLMIPQQSESIK